MSYVKKSQARTQQPGRKNMLFHSLLGHSSVLTSTNSIDMLSKHRIQSQLAVFWNGSVLKWQCFEILTSWRWWFGDVLLWGGSDELVENVQSFSPKKSKNCNCMRWPPRFRRNIFTGPASVWQLNGSAQKSMWKKFQASWLSLIHQTNHQFFLPQQMSQKDPRSLAGPNHKRSTISFEDHRWGLPRVFRIYLWTFEINNILIFHLGWSPKKGPHKYQTFVIKCRGNTVFQGLVGAFFGGPTQMEIYHSKNQQ